MNIIKIIILLVLMLSVSLSVSYFLSKKFPKYVEGHNGKYDNLDGFRGLLAILLFVFHSIPPYPILGQLEYIGFFSFFFVLSGFFFTNKILDKKNEIDWLKLYKSRFFRLVPLHTIVVFIMVFLVFWESKFVLKDNWEEIMLGVGKWLILGIKGFPTINGVEHNFILTNWTLPWEIYFYFTLPLWYILLRQKIVKPYWIFLITIVLSWMFYKKYVNIMYYFFLGGMFISLIIKYHTYIHTRRGNVVLTLIIFLLLWYRSLYKPFSISALLPTTLIVMIFALGYDGFGVFRWNALRFLGRISYGIYLFHVMILSIVNRFLLRERIENISFVEVYLLMGIITFVVVILSFLSYRYIETPFVKIGKKINNGIFAIK